MNVKDLQIGTPVYRVQLDSIDMARVCSLEMVNSDILTIGLGTSWKPKMTARIDDTEITHISSSNTTWFLNLEDAELAQLMRRSEHVEKLKKSMEISQNNFAEAIQKYAFSEPSNPKEL